MGILTTGIARYSNMSFDSAGEQAGNMFYFWSVGEKLVFNEDSDSASRKDAKRREPFPPLSLRALRSLRETRLVSLIANCDGDNPPHRSPRRSVYVAQSLLPQDYHAACL